MYGQYNPYMGATPQMQQRLNYLQQQQQQMYQPTMQQPMTLKGRIQGLYLVTLNADITPTAAGDIGLNLLRNGVAVPGAEATVTGATGDRRNR